MFKKRSWRAGRAIEKASHNLAVSSRARINKGALFILIRRRLPLARLTVPNFYPRALDYHQRVRRCDDSLPFLSLSLPLRLPLSCSLALQQSTRICLAT